jgi:hypothetical protein
MKITGDAVPRRDKDGGMARPVINLEVTSGGSVYLLHRLRVRAHAWISEHRPADARRLGDSAASEWRYIADALGGAIADSSRMRS